MVGNRGFADYELTESSSGPEVPLEENAPAVTDDRRREADLNEAAGAADASRAMLRASCPNLTHRIAVLAHAHFLSTAKPIAYR